MVVAVNQARQKGLVAAVNRPGDSFNFYFLFPSNSQDPFPFNDDQPLVQWEETPARQSMSFRVPEYDP